MMTAEEAKALSVDNERKVFNRILAEAEAKIKEACEQAGRMIRISIPKDGTFDNRLHTHFKELGYSVGKLYPPN